MRLGSVKYKDYSQRRLYLLKLGGRTHYDVGRDEKGEYVLMWNGARHDWSKFYLPVFNDEWLERNTYDPD